MKSLGMSQRQTAAMLGFSYRTIGRYQDGTLETPLNVRLHMEALHRMTAGRRRVLNRIGYSLALKQKDQRHDD